MCKVKVSKCGHTHGYVTFKLNDVIDSQIDVQ